ncbi:hypothetical protein SO694_00044272 [Aureococcus anophagefferens]|uniref:Calmodulin n=1 Tax=Aureococcus anophagefferens TaxID=44056 RepID=A0ABR1G7Y7_AURAN
MSENARVWIRSETCAWVPATVLSKATKDKSVVVRVQLETREDVTGAEDRGERDLTFFDDAAAAAAVLPRNSGKAADVDDLVSISHLNEPAILHVLRRRFEARRIYTAVGAVLCAVNPYKERPQLYDGAALERYRSGANRARDPAAPRPAPHCFAVADDAYRAATAPSARRGPRDQSVLISGESGAGKTETTNAETELFLALRGLAHLGVVAFVEEEGAAVVAESSRDAVRKAAVTLFDAPKGDAPGSPGGGCSSGALEQALVERRVAVSGDGMTLKNSVPAATRARDALLKHAYAALFDAVVAACNASLSQGDEAEVFASIGLLDIFGFEAYEGPLNSLEQLLINYTNERLQRHFTDFVFESEMAEYAREKIAWDPADFAFASNEAERDGAFAVAHYAGTVTYGAGLLVAKNMDAVPGDVAALLPPKCCYLVDAALRGFDASVAPSPLKTPARKRASTRLEITTVAARFRASLAELSRDVDATTPHFIRCLKPNDDNGADALDRPRLVEQLRYCGVLEAVRVARAGYAVRLPHGAFVAAYKCLGGPRFSPAAAVDDGPSLFEDDAGEGDSFAAVERHRDDAEALVAALLAADLDLGKGSLALGASKVFLRHACFDALEAALAARRAAAAVRVAAAPRPLAGLGGGAPLATRELRRGRRAAGRGAAAVAKQKRVVAAPAAPRPITGGKTVEKLRPEAPVVLEASAPLAAVCDAMAAKRTDCALLTDSDGGLAGIVTDNDVARKAVAAGLDCDATPASAVMTARPTCVRSGDAALEALRLMVSNHFRHLPVLGESGAIVGVLNMQKCLYEAITKIETLERLAGDGGDAGLAEAMIAQLAKAGGSKKHLAKLVGPLMESLAGSTAKTLRAVLEDGRTDCLLDADFYFVSDAAATIAATRRAVLATADGGLAGILTPKDVLNRVVAKRLDPAATPLAAVMTPNPDTISLDATLLDALHMMHDNKYLHLPVVDGDAVVGVVDVMEVVYATMGDGDDEGWSTLMSEDFGDDASDRGSVAKTSASVPSASGGRSVEKLRPEAPVVLEASTAISDVCKAMAAKRTDCALLTSAVGTLAGIVTDNDVARKAVAEGLDLAATPVERIMTRGPTCVRAGDGAIDALRSMVSNHFRHLPVLGDTGAIVGVLNIHRCLYEAIEKIEKLEASAKGSDVAESMLRALAKRKGANPKQLAKLVGPLVESLAGSSAKTLRSVLDDGRTDCLVDAAATVRDAARTIASTRRAVLATADGGLAGILTPKDVLNRVVARDAATSTPLAAVMTPNPDTISLDATLLEALHMMHDNKYLHLPVVDGDAVVGVVDVMEVVYATMGDGDDEGWSTLMTLDDDASSDAASKQGSSSRAGSLRKPKKAEKPRPGEGRPVAKLRPEQPVVLDASTPIADVCEAMAARRTDCALLTSAAGALAGIVTDNDVARKAVARELDLSATPVDRVMTRGPTCVRGADSAVEALKLMVAHRFRHLPVLGESGAVVGVLSIHRCLYEAIEKIEKLESLAKDGGDAGLAEAMLRQLAASGHKKHLAKLVGPLMASLTGSSAKTLRAVLGRGRTDCLVSETSSVLDAAKTIASTRRAVLATAGGGLAGILTPKDVLNRVVAKRLDAAATPLAAAMTPNPDTISLDATLLDALHMMHDNKYLHLPVVDGSRLVGVVDVMEVVYATMGDGDDEGWSTLMTQNFDDASSEASSVAGSLPRGGPARAALRAVREDDEASTASDVRALGAFESQFVFKVADAAGRTHRIQASDERFESLLAAVAARLEADAATLCLEYADDDGDVIVLVDDQGLSDAVTFARSSGQAALKLTASCAPEEGRVPSAVLAAGSAAVGAIGLVALRS